MLKTVLIDLDNTMVLFDEHRFYEGYFQRIVPFFAELVDPAEFASRLLDAVASLHPGDGRAGNRDRFLDRFCRSCPSYRTTVWHRFEAFYESHYPKIPVQAVPPDGLRGVLDALKAAGLSLVVATNPVFPAAALKHRLSWVGLEPALFDFVTHIDNMAFVKPQPDYYLEICERIGEDPEHCLMVGNDVINDMSAADAGLKTYLTTDAMDMGVGSIALTSGVSDTQAARRAPDFSGPFAGVTDAAAVLMR